MFNIVTAKKTLFQETSTWAARVVSAGGGFESNSVAIANNLVRQIKKASFGPKIIYLLPMLGRGIGAARTPLIDVLSVGSATNTAFVDTDFNQSTGLQGNGSTKYLNSLVKPSQLGVTSNGGIGWWENNGTFTGNTEPIGCYNNAGTQRYVLDLRATIRFFSWGSPGNAANQATGAVNGHYYGNRSSATARDMYLNGSLIVSNSTSDSASGTNERNIIVCGADESGGGILSYPGRGALSYLTDGTLTATEIALFDAMLRTYLLGPTGKPQT